VTICMLIAAKWAMVPKKYSRYEGLRKQFISPAPNLAEPVFTGPGAFKLCPLQII
jgi:hypothetical protein